MYHKKKIQLHREDKKEKNPGLVNLPKLSMGNQRGYCNPRSICCFAKKKEGVEKTNGQKWSGLKEEG